MTSGETLVARVRRTLATRGLVAPGDAVLVACSGGPDSVAMLDVLARLRDELGLTLRVASVDHGLRPEAAGEVRFVGGLAAERGLAFHPVALGLPAGSTPAAARDARYAALLGLAEGGAIAVGHTLDDQAETVLARLLRGAGLEGLRGIHDRRADGVIRPLLDATRVAVREHLARHGLRCVEDPTNADLDLQRARIRHHLLPALAAESPGIAANLARLADEAATIFDESAGNVACVVSEAAEAGVLRLESVALLTPIERSRAIAGFAEALGGRVHRRTREALERALRDGGEVLLGPDLALGGGPGRLSRVPVPARLARRPRAAD